MPRTETIDEILEAAKRLDVESPYYHLVNDHLQVIQVCPVFAPLVPPLLPVQDERHGIPTSRIKAFLVRHAPGSGAMAPGGGKGKQKYLFAISIAFIERRLALPIADGSSERIVAEMTREQGLTETETRFLRELVNKPLQVRATPVVPYFTFVLQSRLAVPTRDYVKDKMDDWIDTWSKCDVLLNPMAHAIRLALENPVLGRTIPLANTGRVGSSKKDDFEQSLDLLIYRSGVFRVAWR